MRVLAIVFCLILGLATVGPAAAQGPDVRILSPANGATIEGSSFTVRFEVTDLMVVPTNVPVSEAGKRPEVNRPGEGHLHLTLDLDPLIVWDKTVPYVFDNVPPGEHVLMVSLSQNDHSPLSPPVMKEIRFRTGPGGLPRSGESLSWSIHLSLLGIALVGIGLALRGQRPGTLGAVRLTAGSSLGRAVDAVRRARSSSRQMR